MSFFTQMRKNRSFRRRTRPFIVKPHMIAWSLLAGALLIVSVACGQASVTQSKRPTPSPPVAVDLSPTEIFGVIYVVNFTTSTTYTQAHALFKSLGLVAVQWGCLPQAEGAAPVVSGAALPFTTPPPLEDTPDFFAQNHELFLSYFDAPPTPQQLAQLKASPEVAAVKAIPLVSC